MTDELTLAIERFPLQDYVEERGAWQASAREWMMPCPMCGREKLTVNVEKRVWRCFICEKWQGGSIVYGGGGVFLLIKWVESFTNGQTAQFILKVVEGPKLDVDDHLPDALFQNGPLPQEVLHPTGLPENCVAVTGTLPYMMKRGITLEDAQIFGLGYCTSGWAANRLIFPVWEQGQCIYWQGRATWEKHEHQPRPFQRSDGSWDEDKYRKNLNPARHRSGVSYFGSGDVVLNLEVASRYPRVAITEGPTSAIRAGPSAVATFGKQLQPRQISRLVEAGVRAVDFMWDGPSEKEPLGAWPKMLQCAALLSSFMDVRLVFLPGGDPGDYTRQELSVFRAHARAFNDVGDVL